MSKLCMGLFSGSLDKLTAAGVILSGATADDMDVEVFVLLQGARAFIKGNENKIDNLAEASFLKDELKGDFLVKDFKYENKNFKVDIKDLKDKGIFSYDIKNKKLSTLLKATGNFYLKKEKSMKQKTAWTVWLITALFYFYEYILRISPTVMVSDLMESVRKVGGLFVSLWHNESLSESGRWTGWRVVYEQMTSTASNLVNEKHHA